MRQRICERPSRRRRAPLLNDASTKRFHGNQNEKSTQDYKTPAASQSHRNRNRNRIAIASPPRLLVVSEGVFVLAQVRVCRGAAEVGLGRRVGVWACQGSWVCAFPPPQQRQARGQNWKETRGGEKQEQSAAERSEARREAQHLDEIGVELGRLVAVLQKRRRGEKRPGVGSQFSVYQPIPPT